MREDISMTIKLYIGDLRIECTTPAEAAMLVRELRCSSSNGGPKQSKQRKDRAAQPGHANLWLRVLEKIQEAGKTGLTGEELAATAGLGGPQGVGPWTRSLTTQLKPFHLVLSDVLARTDDRRWVAGGKLAEAIEKLRKD